MSKDKKDLVVDEEISTSTWTKKKKYIFALSFLTILLVIIAGALIFYAYQKSQNGIHSNVHQNKSITNSPGIKQESFEIFSIERFLGSSTGYTGYSILLEFGTTSQSNFKSQHWFKDGRLIDTSKKSKYILQNGDLKIKNLTENDAGIYKCLLIYDANYEESVSYNLIIQDAYKWVVPDSPEMEDPAYETFTFNNKFYLGQYDYIGQSLYPGVIDLHSGFYKSFESNIATISNINKDARVKALMINKNVKYDWIEACCGDVPPNAIEAGHFFDGQKVYFGSTLDTQELGVVQHSAGTMRIIIKQNKWTSEKYKVLVLKI